MPILDPAVSGAPIRERAMPSIESSLLGWRLLGWLGVALLIMGATDVGLAWYPVALGNPEWEFGAITASLNGLALPILGAFFTLAAAATQRRRMFVRVVGTGMLIVAAALVILALLYGTVVPLALSSVADNPQLAAGMKKAVLKATVLAITYIVLLVTAGISAWRAR
jgi:hypothetical protein